MGSPADSPARCPECGAPPDPKPPRRPLPAARIALSIGGPALLLASLAVAVWLFGQSGQWGLAGTNDGYVYPFGATDEHLRWFADDPEFEHTHDRFALVHPHWLTLVPLDRPVELGITPTSSGKHPAQWHESAITCGDALDDQITDREIARFFIQETERLMGPGWDTPGDEYVQARLRTPYAMSGSIAYLGSVWPRGRYFSVGVVRPEHPVEGDAAWLAPAVGHGDRLATFRIGIARGRAPIYTMEVDNLSLGVGLSVLLIAAVWPWVLVPPIWVHRRRRRWHRRGMCAGCGYELPKRGSVTLPA